MGSIRSGCWKIFSYMSGVGLCGRVVDLRHRLQQHASRIADAIRLAHASHSMTENRVLHVGGTWAAPTVTTTASSSVQVQGEDLGEPRGSPPPLTRSQLPTGPRHSSQNAVVGSGLLLGGIKDRQAGFTSTVGWEDTQRVLRHHEP